jgi:hypothetical protein
MSRITIPPILCLLFFFCIGWVHGDLKHQSSTDTWYQTWINNSVVSPFLTAYTTLNNKIINKILLVNPDSDEETIKSLIDLLKCRYDTVHTQLRRSNDATEQIRSSLEHQQTILLRKKNSQENLVRSKEKDLRESNINLEHAEKQIKDAEIVTNDYQSSVNSANRDVQAAQNAVDKSNDCKRRRRKRRFLGLCGLLNWKGSNNANERLSLAMHTKHKAQHRLNYQQQILTNKRFRHKVAGSQLKTATAQLHTSQLKLNQTQILFKRMGSFAQRFKAIETYLREISGASTNFKDQLMTLVDFENVIDPLNHIYQEMVNNNLINLNNNNISTETIQSTSENLEKVKETIKTWVVVDKDENDISVPCVLLEND